MHAPAAVLSLLGFAALATALPNPFPAEVSPAAVLVCEVPTGDCSLVGSCQYCCVGDPGVGRCHTHGITPCGTGDEGIVYHCDDEH